MSPLWFLVLAGCCLVYVNGQNKDTSSSSSEETLRENLHQLANRTADAVEGVRNTFQNIGRRISQSSFGQAAANAAGNVQRAAGEFADGARRAGEQLVN